LIKDTLSGISNKQLKIRGELANIKLSRGTLYGTLRDNDSSIQIISWDCKDDLQNGDIVTVSAKINLYVKNGSYNIIVKKFEKANTIGTVHQQYEELKKYCDELGFFDNKNWNNNGN
jgi:exonuclease VII large subunit